MDRSNGRMKRRKFGAIRAALLFGTAAIALAAILTPIVAERSSPSAKIALMPDQYDNIMTSSIPRQHIKSTYVIHQSVLQDAPGAKCIIYNNGKRIGDC